MKYMVFAIVDFSKSNQSEKPSKEKQQKIFSKWNKWAEDFKDNQVDMGSHLMNGKKFNKEGLLNEDVSNIAGYMIIKAENVEEAHEVLVASPLFDGSVPVSYEIFESPM